MSDANDVTKRSSTTAAWSRYLNHFAPLLALLAVYFLFASVAPTFNTTTNVETMARQTAIVGAAAMGMTLVIIAGGIDLSVGSIVSLSAVVTAVLLRDGASASWAAVMAIVVGAVCGLANGVIITRFKLVPFIGTLGTLLIVRGVAKFLSDEQKVDAPRTVLRELLAPVSKERSWMLLPTGVWIVLAVAAAIGILLRYGTLGRHLVAVGSNEATARLCGVAVNRVKIFAYTAGGATAGLAGLMLFARLNVGEPDAAVGLELDVIAAVVIGGGSLSGGEGSVLGTLVGASIMTMIRSGCTHWGLPTYTQEVVTGGIIVVAVALDRYRHRRLG